VNNPPIERVKRLGGLIDAKYPSTGFHEVLDEALGPDNGEQPVPKLSQLLRPTVITSYSASTARPYFFKQHWAARDDGNDFALRDVALATSAAPTFFEAARVAGDGVDLGACVDGGIFANNPALCAYAEAHSYYGYSAKDMAILSLGTGSNPGTYAHEKMRKWGAVRWVMPLIDMLMSGSGAVADFQLAQIFDTLDDSATDHRYIRLQADLSNEHRSTAKMDNADPTNVRRLQRIGENVVRENRAEIERFLDTQILGRTDD
jgi:patatin-like phospholipase/acyl hydrolase